MKNEPPRTRTGFRRSLWLCLVLTGCQAGGEAPPSNLAAAFFQTERARAEAAEADGGEVLNVGFVVLDGVFNSELMAPYDVVHHTVFRDDRRYMMPFIVSPDGRPITSFEGITIYPHASFDDAPPIDVLVIPSTAGSMDADLQNEVYMGWLRRTIEGASYVITVCDGAFPLAATGALDGRAATTFPGDRDRFASQFPAVDVRYDVRLVVDGRYLTSVGGAMSYEPALYLVERLYSSEQAGRIAEGLVWDWDPGRLPHVVLSERDSSLVFSP
jgi:transcriptional regulator GlxA family with amidase domain